MFNCSFVRVISLLQTHLPPLIHRAADDGNLFVLKQCIERGDSVDLKMSNGTTALMAAACSTGCHQPRRALQYLIEKKANVNAVNDTGRFALERAANLHREGICSLLLRAGADRTMKYNGKTAAEWSLSHTVNDNDNITVKLLDKWEPKMVRCSFVRFFDCVVCSLCSHPYPFVLFRPTSLGDWWLLRKRAKKLW